MINDYSFLIDSMTWSYSRIQAFQKCPYSFFVRYILGEDEDETFLASFGSFVHEIHRQVLTGVLPKEYAATYYLEHLHNEVFGSPPSAEVARNYIRGGYEYMSDFPSFDGEVVGVEKELFFYVEGYPFHGFADLITNDDGLILFDHKARNLKPFSGRKKPTKTDVELAEYYRQLYLYAIGIKKEYGEYPKELVFNCYRNQTMIRQKFDNESLSEAVRWAVGLIEEIRGCQNWNPDIDFFKCRNLCGLNDRCDYYDLM